MPLLRYGVWKGTPTAWSGRARPGHGHVSFTDSAGETFDAAINIESRSFDSRLVCWFIRNLDMTRFRTRELTSLVRKFHSQRGRQSLGLNYLRGGFLNIDDGILLSSSVPGENNDILDFLNPILLMAIGQQATMYMFGERYHDGDEDEQNGMHDIHMNQGNSGQWARDNGTYQDGGILLSFPDGHWEGIFLAFAVQATETGSRGRPDPSGPTFAELLTVTVPVPPVALTLFPAPAPAPIPLPTAGVAIQAALVKPFGDDQRPSRGVGETVYLFNRTSAPVSLDGWTISNGVPGQVQALHGLIRAQSKKAVMVPGAPLSNRGGSIMLKGERGVVVHKVTYTQQQAAGEGVLVYFQQTGPSGAPTARSSRL
ncbi:hypothetical protein C8A01DRAFT_21277 [Parachaetomium inaequale]|uniref:LTD domain-containing protein n=1 Tax=Parachaetomium inaequale TaxID=2588326 RepID=A0AAN6P6X1_9PEZI|nr:hypothetical protein C8A01DRAFT_21277 [Parachaetomium inaequale]